MNLMERKFNINVIYDNLLREVKYLDLKQYQFQKAFAKLEKDTERCGKYTC